MVTTYYNAVQVGDRWHIIGETKFTFGGSHYSQITVVGYRTQKRALRRLRRINKRAQKSRQRFHQREQARLREQGRLQDAYEPD